MTTLTAPVTHRSTCRVCPNDVELTSVLDLGPVHISAFPLPAARRRQERPLIAQLADPVPLHLLRCPRCTLVQLAHTVSPRLLYHTYWYRSGVNETMVAELKDIATAACRRLRYPLGATDAVLDIGANDGTLLAHYKGLCGYAPMRVAYEPAETFAADLENRDVTDLVRPVCFPEHSTDGLTAYVPNGFKIITSIAMVYDLEDPNAFVHAVAELLAPDGVWVVQFQDLAGMLETGAFDCVCHEHLEYYTLHSFMEILKHNNLVVMEAERRDINGGSLRCYIGHRGYSPPWVNTQSVLSQLAREDKAGLLDEDTIVTAFTAFERRMQETKRQLIAVLNATTGPVDGYGASTKGNTLLQLFGLSQRIRQIAERSPAKVGRVTVGTEIPIVSEAVWRAEPAGVTLVSIWQFREAVLAREAGYLSAGGQMLFPLPRVEVVGR